MTKEVTKIEDLSLEARGAQASVEIKAVLEKYKLQIVAQPSIVQLVDAKDETIEKSEAEVENA